MNQEEYCEKCALNAKRLHKDLPFGCFADQSCCYDGICEGTPGNPINHYSVKEWIKNHTNWKGTPHMKYWFYCHTQKEFNEFINKYPNKEHAPNDSWIDMYDYITLK